VNVVLEVIDHEDCLGGVDDFPHHDSGELDGIAALVVDLDLAGLEVTHSQAHGLLGVEGVGPLQSGVVDRTDVLAEQLQYLALVGVHGEQAGEHEDVEQQQHPCADECPYARGATTEGGGIGGGGDEQPAQQHDQAQPDTQHQQAIGGPGFDLSDHRGVSRWRDHVPGCDRSVGGAGCLPGIGRCDSIPI